jgi:choline dehydrogenase-like flavoprotein
MLCLNANLVDLRLDDALATVTGAIFKSYEPGDPGFQVSARAYCLCLGGIENARMLLNFRQRPRGIGNDHDLVGRYFCEHPYLFVGYMLLAERLRRHVTSFAPTVDFMKRERTLNFALVVLASDEAPESFVDAAKETVKCFDATTRDLTELLRGYRPACKTQGGLAEFRVRRDPEHFPTARVRIATEQALHADSRVTLIGERDPFGLQRVRLDWCLGDLERRTVRSAAVALGMHLAEQNLGRLRIEDWVLADPMELPQDTMIGSYHHMCTTRMSDDPSQGVVNRDCRVHGMANLYLGGSSVFSTPGLANPTFTIVQLALRLGDHLGSRLRGAAQAVVVRSPHLERLAE